MRFLLFLNLSVLYAYQIINGNKPECKRCIYFEPSPSPFAPLKNRIEYGKCQYYGEKNLLDGTIQYEYASVARKYKDCGENGTRYVQETNLHTELKLRGKLFYDLFIHPKK